MDHLTEVDLESDKKSALYIEFAAIILTYLSQMVSSKQDAEDLLLEVFMAAFASEILFEFPDRRQLAWLRRVARNKAVDRYRHVTQLIMVPLD